VVVVPFCFPAELNSGIFSMKFLFSFFMSLYLLSCSSNDNERQFLEVIFESRGSSDFVADISQFQINGSDCPSIKTFSLPDSSTITGFSTSYVIQGGEGPAGIGQTRDQVSFFRFYSGDKFLAQTPVVYGPDPSGNNLNYTNYLNNTKSSSLSNIETFLFGHLKVRYSSDLLIDINGNSIADILAGNTSIIVELHVGRTRLLDNGIHFRWDPACIIIGDVRVECPRYSCCCSSSCLSILPRDRPNDPCDANHQALLSNEWISRLFYTD
jgi:hypothetical protein